ncbi:fructose-1,6-bisphosphatase [Cohaesibacter sp. ES.047]|uniref:inositol monophosphatase family protein n=1 Tax=Cohaesibacter sp. ES.047 TaxID=1798205 RepID=UPI000BB83864|nr:inositol monophosphatase [Cohaesibacter sp. ES.047]SNY90036.1 fructose-1,6-bisphosphatase [Cohaesibacter sp. ES.047]
MHLDQSEQTALIELVRQAAKAEIMPRFRHLEGGDIRQKSGPDDVVTDADVGAEAVITAGVQSIFSDPIVVGEEAAALNPDIISNIASAEWAVIIDPVDGTWNFANGLATFGVILAVTYKGETCFGLLYDPVLDDWIVANKGEGAFFGRPGAAPRRLPMAQKKPLSEMHAILPGSLFRKPFGPRLAELSARLGRFGNYRCACHEYRLTAQGRNDVSLTVSMNPWDHAAGVLVVEELGGAALMLDGRKYSPSENKGPFIVSAHADSMPELQDTFGWLAEHLY